MCGHINMANLHQVQLYIILNVILNLLDTGHVIPASCEQLYDIFGEQLYDRMRVNGITSLLFAPQFHSLLFPVTRVRRLDDRNWLLANFLLKAIFTKNIYHQSSPSRVPLSKVVNFQDGGQDARGTCTIEIFCSK